MKMKACGGHTEAGVIAYRQSSIVAGHRSHGCKGNPIAGKVIEGPLIQGLAKALVPKGRADTDKVQTAALEPYLLTEGQI